MQETGAEYRYERKFFISGMDVAAVRMLIAHHPAMFSSIYRKRSVNNIYFDTSDLESYHDNCEGTANRMKVRVRWYGDMFRRTENPRLELKIKKGAMNRKESYSVDSFELVAFDEELQASNLKGKHERSALIESILRDRKPVLLNSYSREYFLSSDKSFRLTMDSQLRFYAIQNRLNTFVTHYRDRDSVILELKYGPDADAMANAVSTRFPFRVTKSSKYVRGLEILDLAGAIL